MNTISLEQFERLLGQEIAALMEWGLNLARSSPRRAAIEQRWEAQEEEWQRFQKKLMAQHGK